MRTFSNQFFKWFCALLCLGFALAHPAAAQTVTNPEDTDPGYAARKLQRAQAVLAPTGSPQRLAAARITARAGALARPVCFEAVDTSATGNAVLLPRNDDGSFGPVALGFNFSLFGTIYNQVYINTNGNITFDAPYGEYNASGFPIGVPMIAPFWADVDTRNASSGRVSYALYADRLVVTWNRVAYFTTGGAGPINRKNTFQLTIKANTAPTFTGNDVVFAYDDMQWTTGNASGGTSGFGGTAATVGANRGNNVDFIQTGRFNLNGAQAPNNPTVGTPGGVDFLDQQCLGYQVRGGGNVPPAVAGFPAGNTLTVTQGQTATASFQFSGPETNQLVNVTANLGGLCNTTATVVGNNTANPTVNLSVAGAACNLGSHTLTFSALDNGTPLAAQATFTLTVVVVPPAIPVPTLTLLTPSTGPVGTSVTLTGTNLTGATAVSFNGTAASSFVINSATSITAVVAVGTTTGLVTVTTPGGTATSATSFVVRGAPTTVADAYTTQQGVLLAGNVLTNDIGTNPRAILINRPTRGTLALNPDGTFTYQPVATYSGPDSFTYYACDPALPLLCGNPVTVSITILNSPPTVTLLSPATGPVGTQVTISGTNLTTTTAVSFNGTAASSFVVNSATSITAVVAAGTTTGLVTVTTLTGTATSSTSFVVRVPPTTVADAYTTPQNTTLTGNVLTNDIGTNPQAILIIRPTRGTLLLNPNGTFTYQPAAGYVGPDSFIYYACDPSLPLLCGNPATVSITVVNTAASVSLLYQTGDFGRAADEQVRPFFQLVNTATTAVPYSQLTVRYWLTPESFMGQLTTTTDWVKLGTNLVSARYVALASPRQGAYGYVEYSFAAAAGNLAAGTNSGDIYGKIYKPDYSSFDETDDWSYQTSSSFTTNSHVTVYQNGTLITGTEPPAVAAQTALQVFAANQSPTANPAYINGQLQVRNTGNVPVNYGDLKVRYYLTRDGASALVASIDYAKLGASNVAVRVVNLAAPVSGADAYVELTFAAALGVFYPRTSTEDILLKVRRDDFGTLDQTNDYSASSTTLALQNRLPAYLSNSLVFGTPPTGAPARMAAPGNPAAPAASAPAPAATSEPLELALTGSPNPFAEQLRLSFALPTAQAYTLALYDAQGRLVQQLASSQAEAGQAQQVEVPTHAFAAGFYLVRLTTPTGTQLLKLIKR
jgi:hypothetical protein